MSRPTLNLLRLSRIPIYTQLHLEEALLRATKDNWLIINDGAFNPAIVIGISGRPQELVHCGAAVQSCIQTIRRFTGGGTVVVDHDTIFSTIIMQGSSVPKVECFPHPIMEWTERLYAPAFAAAGCPDFALRENDYTLGGTGRKVGGNAQAITGRRWLHHTSFLWDFEPQRMALLRHPPKAPKYREGRGHDEFVTRLCDLLPSPGGRSKLVQCIAEAARDLGFQVQERTLADAAPALKGGTMLGTRMLDLREFTKPGEL